MANLLRRKEQRWGEDHYKYHKARSMLVKGERHTFSSLLLKSQMPARYCHFLPKVIGRPENVRPSNRVQKPLRNDEDLLYIRILHFAPRSVTGHVHVLARIIWAINVAGLSRNSPCHGELRLRRRCPGRRGSPRLRAASCCRNVTLPWRRRRRYHRMPRFIEIGICRSLRGSWFGSIF